jgi:hypothetical protein
MKRAKCFTLVEVAVGILVFSLILAAGWRLLQQGLRGTQFGREATDHSHAIGILFRMLGKDFARGIPMAIVTRQAPGGGRIEFAPSAAAATSFMFPIIDLAGEKRVRYSFSAPDGEVVREEMDQTGGVVSRFRVGTGLIHEFTASALDPAGSCVRIRAVMKGKIKKSTFERVLATGFRNSPDLAAWIWDFPK